MFSSSLSDALYDTDPIWVIDSSCTQFMCNKLYLLSNLSIVNISIKLGDDTVVQADQARLVTMFGFSFRALYTPSFCISLISVSDLNRNGFICTFADAGVIIKKDNLVLGRAILDRAMGLYVLSSDLNTPLEEISDSEDVCASGVISASGDAAIAFASGDAAISSGDVAISSVENSLMALTRSQSRRLTNRGMWDGRVSIAGLLLLRNRCVRKEAECDWGDEYNELESGENAEMAENKKEKMVYTLAAVHDGKSGVSHELGAKKRRLLAPLKIWHARLGHIHQHPLRLLLKNSPGTLTIAD